MKLKKYISIERQITFAAGFHLTAFGLGFSVDRCSFTLNLGPFWFGIEY